MRFSQQLLLKNIFELVANISFPFEKKGKRKPIGLRPIQSWGGTAALIIGRAADLQRPPTAWRKGRAPYRTWLLIVRSTIRSLMRRDCSLPQPTIGCPPVPLRRALWAFRIFKYFTPFIIKHLFEIDKLEIRMRTVCDRRFYGAFALPKCFVLLFDSS